MTSEWSEAPALILRIVFGLQLHPLDNCAAACTCSTWRQSVNSTSIGFLHLELDNTQPARWESFLRSRSIVGSLKLTASTSLLRNLERFLSPDDTADSIKLPTMAFNCKRLYLGRYLGRFLPGVLHTPTQLQLLSMHWPREGKSDRLDLLAMTDALAMPDLQQLTHLCELAILKPVGCDLAAGCLSALLGILPVGLRTLELDSIDNCHYQERSSPYILPKAIMESHPNQWPLQHLALTNSRYSLPGDSITCFGGLETLDLQSSCIYVTQQLDITHLTKLTKLDLTDTLCYLLDDGSEAQACHNLAALWRLGVFKLQGTNVVHREATLNVSNISEIHIGWPMFKAMCMAAVDSSRLAVHLKVELLYCGNEDWASYCGKSVVELCAHVHLSGCCHDGLFSFIRGCVSLQSLELSLSNQDCVSLQRLQPWETYYPELKVAIGPLLVELTHLQHLHLQEVLCMKDLCLDCLVSLTSLTLIGDFDWRVFDKVIMPTGLQELHFEGACLFVYDTQDSLHVLTQLTMLELELRVSPDLALDKELNACLPAMPVSLKRLVLSSWKRAWPAIPDWSVLKACSNLSHLTVPQDLFHSDDLQNVIAASRQLRVVDCM